MTTDDAKSYLSKKQIPRLFESLMTGLMFHRPGDHIKYLIDCLQKVQDKGQDAITWSSFVDMRRNKTPLPPIDKGRPGSKGSSRPTSRTRTPAKEESPREVHVDDSRPLPPIPTAEKVEVPDVPIVVFMGAPGSEKDVHAEKLLKRYPDWAHVNMGNLIREEIVRRGDAHSKWRMTKDLLSKGEAAPEEVTVEVLVEGLKKCSGAKGIIVNGYPRSMVQVGEYNKVVGRMDCAFMFDCDEQQSLDRLLRRGKETGNPEDTLQSIAARLNYFKSNTLEAAKCWDDEGKLIVIDGDQGTDKVGYDLGMAFDKLFLKEYGTHALEGEAPKAEPLPPPPTYKGKYEKDVSDLEDVSMFSGPPPQPPVIDEPDTGRKPGLPECPIIFVAGGPGSGKGTQCEKIVQRYPGFVHLSMGDILRTQISDKGTADEKWSMISQLLSKGEMAPEDETVDLLKENMKKHMSAKAFLIEGFPRNKEQIEAFNKCIGGLNFVLLFDCEEYYMQNRLIKRGKESGRIDDNISAIAKKLHYYKHNTLPIMKYYDDNDKLVVLDADKDMTEMFFEISKLMDYAFYGDKSGEKSPELPEDKKLAADALRIHAAVKIQANYRGYVVRRDKWDTLRDKHKEAITDDDKPPEVPEDKKLAADALRIHAAVKIQANYRGYVVRRDKWDTLRDKHKEAITDDDKPPELPEDKKLAADVLRIHAAVKIQANYRGYVVRRDKWDTLRDKHKEAITDDDKLKLKEEEIQKPPEKPPVVEQVDEVTKEADTENIQNTETAETVDQSDIAKDDIQGYSDEYSEAADRIHAGYRGYQTRSEFKAKKEKQQADEEAASRIQAGFRGFKARSESKDRKAQSDEPNDEDLEDAVARIQASYRGYKARSGAMARNNKGRQSPNDEEDAASRIQAGYRGYKTRHGSHAQKEDLEAAQKPGTPEPVMEEVVEEPIILQESTTTGDDIANPSHTEKLDEIAKQEESSS